MLFEVLDKNNEVVNVVVANIEFMKQNYTHYRQIEEPLPTIQVPQTVTPLQAKLQLLAMGLLDEVETMVATDRKVQLYWSEALEIKRDHQTLLQMALALGLSDAQLDEMFIEADKLS